MNRCLLLSMSLLFVFTKHKQEDMKPQLSTLTEADRLMAVPSQCRGHTLKKEIYPHESTGILNLNFHSYNVCGGSLNTQLREGEVSNRR